MRSLCGLIAIFSAFGAFQKNIKVGIVYDGAEKEGMAILAQIKNSLNTILDNPNSVKLQEFYFGDYQIPKVLKNFEQANLSTKTDMVISIGPISSYGSSLRKNTAKANISTHLFDRTLKNKKNLAALKIYPDLVEVKDHLAQLDTGKNILVVCQAKDVLNSYLEQINKELGSNYLIKFFKTDRPANLDLLNSIDLVFYLPKPFPAEKDFMAFQKLVNQKNIKSYSLSGIEDFKFGVLAAPEIINFNERLSRLIALSLMEYLNGKSIDKLPQNYLSFKKVVSNKEISFKFGLNIENLSIISPVILEKPRKVEFTKLYLQDAVRNSLDQNLSYQSAKYAFEVSDYQRKSSYANFFPQIGLQGFSDLYKDPNSFLLTRTTEDYSAINLSLNQFVFSDNALANYQVSKYTTDQYHYKNELVKIDTIAATLEKYLETLTMQSITKIREENLALTAENLQIAELNFKTGKSSKFEVYRWESQLADNKKELAGANFEYNRSLHELNRLMNVDLSKQYVLEDYSDLEEKIIDKEVHLPSKYKSLEILEKYISFVILESRNIYPLFKEVEQSVKIAERQLLNKDRAFYLPKVELFSDYFFIVGPNPFAEISASEDFRVGIRFTYPIFDGLNRFFERSTEVRRLNYAQTNKNDIYQQVEKSLRDQIVGIRTSFDQIRYEEERAKAAKSNLDLIKLSYKTGKVDILFLLDAQNSYLKAREGVVMARINFLLEIVRLEKRMGQFYFLRNLAEVEEFHDRYHKFVGIKSV